MSSGETEDAGLRHIEARRGDVKPEESEDAAEYHQAERRKVYLILKKSDAGKGGKDGRHNAAGEAIQAVNHALGKERKHYRDEKRNKIDAEKKGAVEGQVHRAHFKTRIEPPCPCEPQQDNDEKALPK